MSFNDNIILVYTSSRCISLKCGCAVIFIKRYRRYTWYKNMLTRRESSYIANRGVARKQWVDVQTLVRAGKM